MASLKIWYPPQNLYKMNRKDGEYVPEIGDRLRLR